MALRQIRKDNDPILRKTSKPVLNINENVKILAEDMVETMYASSGVGLAAPQVGILKRLVVIDIGEGPIIMINPEIVEKSGEIECQEGCLSFPGIVGDVTRPSFVKAKALNLNGEEFIIEGEELLARAICHEIDHLNGVLFIDLAKNIREVE